MKQTRNYPMKQTRNETAVITTTGRVTAARLAIRAARPRRRTSTLLWAAQILMAVAFVNLGVAKLAGGQVQEFGLIGAGQWLRYFVGTTNWPGGSACSCPGWPGWPPPGWPPRWPARPSSTPQCCTTPHTAALSGSPCRCAPCSCSSPTAGGSRSRLCGRPSAGNGRPNPGTAHAQASDVMMMSFTEPETQALGSIADGLAGSDPRLASMLTIFGRLAAGEEMPAREKTRVRRGRPAAYRPR